MLQDEAVRFYGQPIAVVVARSLVQAEPQLCGSSRIIVARRLLWVTIRHPRDVRVTSALHPIEDIRRMSWMSA